MIDRIPISKKLFFKNSFSAGVTKVIQVTILVYIYQYLLGRISTSEYAIFPVVMGVMAFIPVITTLLGAGQARFILEAYAKRDEHRVRQLSSSLFVILSSAGALVLVGGLVFAWKVDRILNIAPEYAADARIMMGLLFCSAGIQLAISPFITGFYVKQKFMLNSVIELSAEFFRSALLFLLLFGVSTRVLWLVVAMVTTSVLTGVTRCAVSLRLVPALRFGLSYVDLSSLRELFAFNFWSCVRYLAAALVTGAPPIILNKLATPFDVTCYHLGSIPFRQIQGGIIAVINPIMPVAVTMQATGARERLRNLYLRMGRMSLWLSMFIAAPFLMLSSEIVTLWVGSSYFPAAIVMTLLLLIYPTTYCNAMMGPLTEASGKAAPLALRMMLVNGCTVLFMAFFVGVLSLGAVGAALGMTLAMSFGQIFLHWPLGRRLAGVGSLEIIRRAFFPGMLPCMAATGFWALCRASVNPSSPIELAAVILPGWILYVGVLLPCMAPEDRADAQKMLNKLLSIVKRTVTASTGTSAVKMAPKQEEPNS